MNNEERSRHFASMPIRTLLKLYALPSMLAMSSTALFNICDTIFLGNGVGYNAVAALAVTFPLMTLISALGALTNVGGNTRVAMCFGKDDNVTAMEVSGSVLVANVAIGLLFSIVSFMLLDMILPLFGASEATLPLASEYMRIFLFGLPFALTIQSMSGQLRAIGCLRLAMIGQLMAIAINLVLDPIFIFSFGWGVRGAAFATVLSQVISWTYFVYVFSNRTLFVHLSKHILKLRRKVLSDVFSIGLSPLLANLCGCAVVVLINLSLISQGGEDGDKYLGAYTIVQRIIQLLVMMTAGLTQGIQPIVSYNFAAQNFDRTRRLLMSTIFSAMGFMTIGYLFIAAFADNLVGMFFSVGNYMDICTTGLRISMCVFPFVAGQMVAVSFFYAIRQPRVSMIISLTRQIMFLIPLLLILPGMMGVNGVWWSMALADVTSVVITWGILWAETKKLVLE